MKKQNGFTLIEIVLFLVITSILASAILLSITTGLVGVPQLRLNTAASQTASRCIEWFLGQRRLLGYSAFSCPSTSVPSFCSTPPGYTLSVNISCTTISSDSNYQTITVTVGGNSSATLTTLVANY